jgi:STIMATE family
MLVDTTVGVITSWILVRFLDILFAKAKIDALVSGNYFVLKRIEKRREYFVSYSRWFWQCIIWCLISAVVTAASP